MGKNKTNYYYKSKRYKMMKEKLESEYGQELVIKIFDKAGENLNKLYKKYENASKNEKFHLYNSILPRIAMYQILSEELNSDKAMEITEETVKDVCSKIGNILGKITSLPGMSSLFYKYLKLKPRKNLEIQVVLLKNFIIQKMVHCVLIFKNVLIVNIQKNVDAQK